MGKLSIKKPALCLFLAVTMFFTNHIAYAAQPSGTESGVMTGDAVDSGGTAAVQMCSEVQMDLSIGTLLSPSAETQSSQGSASEGKKNPGWERNEDGTWSFYDKDGYPVTGWFESGNDWYYIKPETNRTAKSESLVIRGTLYYFKNDGVMAYGGWVKENDTWYLAEESGALLTGWQKIDGIWYYLEPEEGKMLTGFQDINGKTYLFSAAGVMQTGWKTFEGISYFFRADGSMKKSAWESWSGGWYYLKKDGKMAGKGWLTVSETKKYYLDENGKMMSGWQKLAGKWYYFGGENDGAARSGWQKLNKNWYYFSPDDNTMLTGWQKVKGLWYYLGEPEDGSMKTGWQKLAGKWYYFDKTTGRMQTGWQKIGSGTYYLGGEGDGAAKTGWQKISGIWYYFSESSCAIKTGWLKDDGKWYYLRPDKNGAMAVGWLQIGEKWYYFYSNGKMASDTIIDGKYYVDGRGVWIEDVLVGNRFTSIEGGKKTIKNLLQNAMKPVGTTLYIWGGGHDTGTNGDGNRYGVNPQWEVFYYYQDSSYDYNDHRWEYGNGLDCSGFVGWAVYNTIYTKSNQPWKPLTSSEIAPYYADTKGWGTLLTNPTAFKPGDVVTMTGHTYIVVGQCGDGSMVLVHAAPPAVQISGTCTPGGSWNSEARVLAQYYMDRYFPDWYFTSQGCGTSYMKNIKVNRWKVNGTGILTDPDGYRNMSAEEVLVDLFGKK